MKTLTEIRNAIEKQKETLDNEMFQNLLVVLWDLVNREPVVGLTKFQEYDAELEDSIVEWHPTHVHTYYEMTQASSKDAWVFFPALYEVMGKNIHHIESDNNDYPEGKWIKTNNHLLEINDGIRSILTEVLSGYYPESYTSSVKKEYHQPFAMLGDLLKA